jgi:hypothetical protein
MKLSASPVVVRVWIPISLVVGVCLFFHGMPLVYWLLGLPPLLIAVFISTLAEIQDEDQRIRVKTLWKSMDVPKEQIVRTAQSFLEGIGVLQLQRFVLPWGKIFFIADWSKFGVVIEEDGEEGKSDEAKPYGFVRATLESLAIAASGFFAALGMRSSAHDFRIQTSKMQMLAFALAGVLCIVFAIVRKRNPGFANVTLFVAAWIAGLVDR